LNLRRGVLLLVIAALVAGGGWWLRERAARTAPPGGPAPVAGAPATSTAAPASGSAPGATSGSGAGSEAAAAMGVIEFAPGDLATLAPVTLERQIPLTGTLRAVHQTLVRAKVAGELLSLSVREGDTVRAGQPIARIDPADFEARVREREAQARSAETQLEQARRTLENNRQLLTRGFISQNAFDNAQSGADVAVAARDAALAQLAQARKALADTTVVAPMAGIVAERFVQPGEKVSPDNRMVSIVDLARMEIEAPVPAADVGAVSIGQRVVLHVEGVDAHLAGQVVRIAPGTSAGTRSVPVYIGVENRDARIRAGLFARGELRVGALTGVVAVPEVAVREQGGRTFVYAIADGRLVARDVVTGLRSRDPQGSALIEIRSGLAAGERIVAVNLGTLRPGARVMVAAPAPAKPATSQSSASPSPPALPSASR